MSRIYLVYYFDDMLWCVDGAFSNLDSAEARRDSLKRTGLDSYVDDLELED